MKQLLQSLKTGDTFIEECPTPSVSSGSIRIQTTRSLISPGTEKMLVDFGKSSVFNKAKKQPEKVKQVFNKIHTDGVFATYDAVKSKLNEPIKMGYSNVGIIDKCASDIEEFKIGDRVVSNGPHSDHVVVGKNLCAHIPDNVSDEDASFTVVGSIALQGIRLLKPSIGEYIVIIGVGLIGLLAVQILKANGCKVLAVDYDQSKLDLAKNFGAEILNLSTDSSLNSYTLSKTNGYGADGVLICASTDSNDPIKDAAEISKKRGKIILVGVTGLEIDRGLFYEKELTFQVSCSYGPGRYDYNYESLGQDYPLGYVRWTEKRNFEAFLELLSSNAINVKPLISIKYNFKDATKAYSSLLENKNLIGVLLKYDFENIKKHDSVTLLKKSYISQKPVIGFIGSGNYASRVLIPNFKKNNAQLHSIVTSNGLSGTISARENNFSKSLTNFNEFISDKDLNTVIIATKHNSHADMVEKCLNLKKNVWVEKPLAISLEEHLRIKNLFLKNSGPLPQLMVGFNRRFSPLVTKMHSLLTAINIPKSIIITVNAGTLPSDHWTQSIEVGGGRIIGEACHFIDLARYLVGKKIVETSVSLFELKKNTSYKKDTVTFSLKFEDGSIATIHYFANGSSKFQKERIEAFCDGRVLQLNNFKNLKGFGWKNFKKISLLRQNKGQAESVKAFLNSITSGKSCIPLDEIIEVSEKTLEIDNKLRSID